MMPRFGLTSVRGRILENRRLTRAAELAEAGVEETLTYYGFPEEHWRRIRTNNPLERILREIRRRTRVVGAFPDGQSALNLAAARLRRIAGTAWATKRYLNIELLKDQQMRGAITAGASAGRRSAQTKCGKESGHYLQTNDAARAHCLLSAPSLGPRQRGSWIERDDLASKRRLEKLPSCHYPLY